MTSKIKLLVLNTLSEEHQAALAQACITTFAATPETRAAVIKEKGAEFTAVLTIGLLGLTREEMLSMPFLKLICCMGAGYEGIDVQAARSLGITLVNGRGTNDNCAADHAMGLVIATMRNFRKLDQLCRDGVWRTAIAQPTNISGKRMGIFGLGMIGEKIAKRAAAFDMEIGYHNRNPKPESTYTYFDHLLALAEWCDVLVCAAPGGAETMHIIDSAVLSRLGPKGYLINIGRGSLVETTLLAEALRDGVIAGAGIDVYETEPARPEALLELDNLLITPHLAGWSPEATQAQLDLVLANLDGYFSGNGAITPV
ncbi:2-hydroxyacid dehydrogenase [Rouxiella sp. WC2420]|uniref:2-hydroxyacid dehydrogenase n=1 Tax=Rouxiella sp. WC2420 TaxID=3234145 RepID=A0AB39VW83_9GAMM